MRLLSTIAVGLLLGSGCASLASDKVIDCLRPDTNMEVVVEGRLRREEHRGAPNYGETPDKDVKFVAWILDVSNPVSRVGRGGAVLHIQVHGPRLKKAMARLDGQFIRAAGRLWSATTPGDVTPMILAASSIEQVLPDEDGLACRNGVTISPSEVNRHE